MTFLAFGGFGALHTDFAQELRNGMALADSLTLDGHKWYAPIMRGCSSPCAEKVSPFPLHRLNVPYDCGLFFTKSSKRHQAIFGPGASAPAYLSAAVSDIPSPLNVGIENSRRFRALPLYCSLVTYGKRGYQEIIRRNIAFARSIEQWLRSAAASKYYDVLTPAMTPGQAGKYRVLNIVLFAPSRTCGKTGFEGEDGGSEVVRAVNEGGDMYVTATRWKGRSAVRLAVSNHLTGLDQKDLEIVKARLLSIMQ